MSEGNGNYAKFLESKRIHTEPLGFKVEPEQLNPKLFEFQRAIVRWALFRGRADLFEDPGLGKTLQSLEWARCVHEHTNGRQLILTPLAVAPQFVTEGEKFGIEVTHCRTGADIKPGINVTNYERLHHFDPKDFSGLICDEVSYTQVI